MATLKKKKTSLAAKKTFAAKVRSVNYIASLKLEGFKVPNQNDQKPSNREELIAKYKIA